MKKYVAGADVGGTTVKLGIFEKDGKLLETWEIPTRKEGSGEQILPDIAEAIKAKLAEMSIDTEEVEGIGMGVPGPVTDDGTVLKCVNLGWGVFNVEKKLSELAGMKVKAGNDANVAALGEMWMGGGKGYRNLVVVTLGTGVGGGVIVDGKVISGHNGAAGEIGHIPMVDDEEDTCGCGKRGCLEQYTSANGIVRVAKHYLAENPDVKTPLRDEEITSLLIFNLAKAGDEASLYIVNKTAAILGKGLAGVAAVVGPDAFVIGGGVSNAGAILIDAVKAGYQAQVFHALRDVVFETAKLGNLAGIYGAAYQLIS